MSAWSANKLAHGARKSLGWIAVALAGALFLLRVRRLDLAPFVGDEPQFLMLARTQLETGHLATHTPVVSSSGVFYGPAPLWFYGLVQAILGSDAQRSILAAGLTVSLSELVLIVALHRAFPRASPYSLACLLAFAAAAPFELFWSRLAWNVLPNAIPFVAIALICPPVFGIPRLLVFALLLGFGLSAHPMTIPFLVIASLFVAKSFVSEPTRKQLVTRTLVAGVIVPNVPWFAFLLGTAVEALGHARECGHATQVTEQVKAAASTVSHEIDLAEELVRWFLTFQPHGTAGFSWFFGDDWTAFAERHPLLASNTLAVISIATVAALSIVGLLELRKHEHAGLRRIAKIGLYCALVYPIFYTITRLGLYAHYQFPVAWMALVGIAGLLYSSGPWRLPAHLAVILVTGSNLLFDSSWMRFVADRDGTRTLHYGTPVAEQQRFVDELCRLPDKDLVVVNRTAMLKYSLQHHFQTNPRCREHTLTVCPAAGCESMPAAARVVPLEYAQPEGGALQRPPSPADPPSR